MHLFESIELVSLSFVSYRALCVECVLLYMTCCVSVADIMWLYDLMCVYS